MKETALKGLKHQWIKYWEQRVLNYESKCAFIDEMAFLQWCEKLHSLFKKRRAFGFSNSKDKDRDNYNFCGSVSYGAINIKVVSSTVAAPLKKENILVTVLTSLSQL